MRFLKRTLLAADDQGRVVIDTNAAIQIPSGTTAERPTIGEGAMRFNTDNSQLEAYISGSWDSFAPLAALGSFVEKQTFGPTDGVETLFGPLSQVPAEDESILVLVENVLQISDVNYNVVESDGVDGGLGPNAPYAAGHYVKFTTAPPAVNGGGDDIYVTVLHGYA